MPSPLTLSIIVPAHNEALRIRNTIRRLQQELHQFPQLSSEVLLVDDGSTDQTAAIVKQLSSIWPALKLVSRHPNQGKGEAVRSGMLLAKGQVRIFMDADMPVPPSTIWRFVDLIQGGNDIVIGSRRLPDAIITTAQPFYRRLMSRAYSQLVSVFTGLPYHDTQCGFKAFSGFAANACFTQVQETGYGFDVETLMLAQRLHLKIQETGVEWHHQAGGQIHPWRDSWRMGKALISVTWRYRHQR